MSAEWPVVRLGKHCLKVGSGATPKGGKSVYLESGDIALIRSQNIYNDGFKANGLAYITPQAAEKLNNVEVQPNDILLNITGDSVARVCLAPDEHLPARVNQHVAIIRPDPKEFDARFLRYFLTSPTQQELLLSIASAGATRNALTKSHIESLEVCKPDLQTQSRIADQLHSLESKIQLNGSINQTLEQMAQAIFKSWFVDFEPVKAKIAAREQWLALQPVADAASPVCYADQGEALPDLDTWMNLAAMQAISGKSRDQLTRLQTESPEQYATLCATAELFPSAMQGSELGEIPERWGAVRIEQYMDLVYGKPLKKATRVDGPYPVYGSGGLTGSHNEFLVPGPGIIIGRKGTVGSIYWESNNFFPIDTTYYVSLKNGCSLSFAYYLLQTLGLDSMNTDAAVPGLNRSNVYRLKVPAYPVLIINRFSQIIDSITQEISSLNTESQALSDFRDALLPRLLSGELTIPSSPDRKTQSRGEVHV